VVDYNGKVLGHWSIYSAREKRNIVKKMEKANKSGYNSVAKISG
jgi:hypothetical protein